MTSNANTPRIIPLEEGWNDEIKAKVGCVTDTVRRRCVCNDEVCEV